MIFLNPNEELRAYRDGVCAINEHISIHIPTLGEICDMGEDQYFSFVRFFLSTPTDLCVQLYDMGIDFTKLSDYQLFSQLIRKTITPAQSGLLFGALDFSKMQLREHPGHGQLVLSPPDENWFLDECTYESIAEFLRNVHFWEKNVSIPANESTKEIIIEDAREEARKRRAEGSHSVLKNWISAMVNSEGFKYNHREVWDLSIHVFIDSVMRIEKIKNARLLLQSGYSGFGIKLSDVNRKELDWLGNL